MIRHARVRPPLPVHFLALTTMVVLNVLLGGLLWVCTDALVQHTGALDPDMQRFCREEAAIGLGLDADTERRYRIGEVEFDGPNRIRLHLEMTPEGRGAAGEGAGDGTSAAKLDVLCTYSPGGVDDALDIDAVEVRPS